MNPIARLFVGLLLVLGLPVRGQAEAPKENNLVATLPFRATQFASDPARHRIYATGYLEDAVAVIDTQTLTITKTIPVGTQPVGLTLSADGAKLFVVVTGAKKIAVIDLGTLVPLPSLATDFYGWNIQAGLGDRLYVSGNEFGIRQVDGITGADQGLIAENTYSKAALQISADRKTLYAADTQVNGGGVLEKIDVSTTTAALTQKIGAEGRDLKLSHDGTTLVYGTHLFNAVDLTVKGTFPTPQYPSAVAFTGNDAGVFTPGLAYGNTASGIILLDAAKFTQRALLPMNASLVAAVTTDISGRYLFVADDKDVNVYDLYADVAPNLFLNRGPQVTYQAPIYIVSTSVTATTMPPGLSFDAASQTISGAATQDGVYPVTITGTDGTRTVTAQLTLTIYPDEFAANMSTRGYVGSGDDSLIAGFIITGGADQEVVLRCIGPSLQLDGKPLAGRLADTTLELYDATGALIASNDDYGNDPQDYVMDSFALTPRDGREAALYRVLAPGAYTLVMRGASNSTGIGVAEIYGVDNGNQGVHLKRLANLSTRGQVAAGDKVMIAGVIVLGSDPAKMPKCSGYSARNAVIGSTPLARRAGNQHAITAIEASNAATHDNVAMSVASTP